MRGIKVSGTTAGGPGRFPRRRIVAILAATVSIALAPLSSCTPLSDPLGGEPPPLEPIQSPIMNGHNTARDQALLTMEVLAINPTPMSGYSAEAFQVDEEAPASESGWENPGVSDSTCTVPEAALVRDGYDVRMEEGTCDPVEGRWFDPLSGDTLSLDTVEARGFLPSERVWRSGGSAWTERQFEVYRNAPKSVLSISEQSYEDRGQQGPGQWRPEDKSLWCGYALRWVSEKSDFGLSLESQGEADALTEMLNTCPDEGFIGVRA